MNQNSKAGLMTVRTVLSRLALDLLHEQLQLLLLLVGLICGTPSKPLRPALLLLLTESERSEKTRTNKLKETNKQHERNRKKERNFLPTNKFESIPGNFR
jgi:hypothetical protein